MAVAIEAHQLRTSVVMMSSRENAKSNRRKKAILVQLLDAATCRSQIGSELPLRRIRTARAKLRSGNTSSIANTH
ncbi:Os04g0413401 [Oryza sativa Japonica Group]|uniref:Os04g0413401 protein n=1 Tax=Oryza sativa subsp. japonica TaxID=39947 RepID=A0A0P0WAC8_ORYSJ|nr:Os04g0413401 [Oryza sativa Japonica Group]